MSHEATTSHHTTVHFDWKGWLARQGFNAVLLSAFAYFIAFYLVVPMRDDQTRFLNSVIETNKIHADVALKQTVIQQQTATALIGMSEVLEQIRDDQRSGVWRESKTAQKQ